MADDVFEFGWYVPGGGYCWVESSAADGPILEEQPGDKFTLYEPVREYPALFREFAGLEEGPESFLRFANKYGSLGAIGTVGGIDPAPETLRYWVWQVGRMRQAVRLWDMVQARDRASLAKYFGRDPRPDEPGWVYRPAPGDPPGNPFRIAWARPNRGQPVAAAPDPYFDAYRKGDALFLARFAVLQWVNEGLLGDVPAAVRAPSADKSGVVALLLFSLQRGTQELCIHPYDLASALWLQLARAIAGNKEYRQCKECGGWFEVSSDKDARTARRVFCSDPCKSRDYRRRKEQAQRLKGEGKAVKDIARELDTDVATIKKWLSKKGT
jgi:hypothetical protein